MASALRPRRCAPTCSLAVPTLNGGWSVNGQAVSFSISSSSTPALRADRAQNRQSGPSYPSPVGAASALLSSLGRFRTGRPSTASQHRCLAVVCSGPHAAAQWPSSAAPGDTPRTRQCPPMDHPRGVHITAIRAAFVSAIKMPRLAQSARHLGIWG